MGLNDRGCTQWLGRHRAQGRRLGLAGSGLARLLATRGLRFDRTPPALAIAPIAPPAARLLALARGARCSGLRFGDRLGDLCLGLRRFTPALAAATTAFSTLSTLSTFATLTTLPA